MRDPFVEFVAGLVVVLGFIGVMCLVGVVEGVIR
jgi:hypothetical protein